MNYLFFFIYLGVFCWLLTKIKFVQNSGIEKKIIIALFLIRVIAGAINSYISIYHYPGTDAAFFHQESIKEFELLFSNPKEYLTDLFKANHYSGFLDITDSFWNNLRSNVVIKLLSIFNIFSNCNFFINTIFFNFIVFFGSVCFYKLFMDLFPDRKKLLILTLFLLPSLLYFTAGIQKDGLIFLGLAMCSYNLFYLFKNNFSFKRILGFAAGLIIIFLLRNFVLLTLIPALTAWFIAERNKKYILQTYLLVYLLFVIVFFTIGTLHPALDLPQYVSSRQIAFVQLARSSQSAININPLYSNFRSFLNNAAQALNHSLMRPYFTEKFSLLYIPAALEIFIYEILFVTFLLFRVKNKTTHPFIYFGVFFSVSMFLMIGYTIPIIGAIVRYRSIYFPLLIIPILIFTDWEKIKSVNFKKNNNT